METIIKCAIKGGYTRHEHHLQNSWGTDTYCPMLFCDPSFWQAIGKACGWTKNDMDTHVSVFDCEYTSDCALCNSVRFHEINLTEGWDSAVSWLEKLISE
jgi:hypothetical protein